ncbi:hypothetical protein [Candidatus Lariskella endosymbiont of Epinotia ramella]
MLSLIKSRILINLYGYARGLMHVQVHIIYFSFKIQHFAIQSILSTQ